jgi:hypothetical protein
LQVAGGLACWELAPPNSEWSLFRLLLYFVPFPSSSSSSPPHFSTLIIASFIFPYPMQLDVQEWTVTQIIIKAEELAFCLAWCSALLLRVSYLR